MTVEAMSEQKSTGMLSMDYVRQSNTQLKSLAAVRAWKELRGVASGVSRDVLHADVAQLLWGHRVLPTQVKERLCRDSVR